MRGTKAKRLRREARERGDLPKPKQYFQPFTLPLPRGKIINEETEEREMVETYIPRRERRKFMRQFMTDLRKGRVDLSKLQENKQ
jgi:hypothetical protein